LHPNSKSRVAGGVHFILGRLFVAGALIDQLPRDPSLVIAFIISQHTVAAIPRHAEIRG
jgi:hypothetical protein